MAADGNKDSCGATSALASFICNARFERLPESAVHAGRRAIVNIVGCCLGGARHEIVETATSALLPLGGAGPASLLGRNERTDMLTAALLNALSSAAYSFDDTHSQTLLHPSGVIAATLLALAEQAPMKGRDLLLAFVLGVDVASRVSKSISMAPAKSDIGWSQTGLAAGIGAAAAAAKALRLDSQATTWALSIAALQASGFRVAHGTMSATLIFGHAAQSGLRAAFLARRGFDAPNDSLEGKFGFASLFAEQPHLPYLDASLGDRFEVELLGHKPYPCGSVFMACVDAALAWRRSHTRNAASIERVQVRAHPSAMVLGYRRHPRGVLEAKVSLYQWVAAALSRGRANLAEGQQAAIDDPEIARFRDLIEVDTDPALAPDAAVLTVTVAGGRQDTVTIEEANGSVTNPMSDEDLGEKFRGQAHLQLASAQAANLLESCWKVDRLEDAGDIARLACAG